MLQSALSDLKKLLLQNGYSQGVISYKVNDVLNRNKNKPNNPVLTVLKKAIIILLTYLGLHSNQVSKRLKLCVYIFYSCISLKIIFQNAHRIKSYFPYKDRPNCSQMSKIIYKNGIGIATNSIEKTSRQNKTEHFKVTVLQPLLIIKNHWSQHYWDHFDISGSGKTEFYCKVKEILLIQELQPFLNVDVSSEKLMLYQLSLLRTEGPNY